METGHSDDFYQQVIARFDWLDDNPVNLIDPVHRTSARFPRSLDDLKVGDTYLRSAFLAYLKAYHADANLVAVAERFLADRTAKVEFDAHWKSAAQKRLDHFGAEYDWLKETFNSPTSRQDLSQAYWRIKVGVTPEGSADDGEQLRASVRVALAASKDLKGLINDILGCLAQAKELGWPNKYAWDTLRLTSGDLTSGIGESMMELGKAEGPLNWLPNDLSDPKDQGKIVADLANHDRVCRILASQLQNIADLWYVSFKDQARKSYIKNIEVNDPQYALGMQTVAVTFQKIGAGLTAVGHVLPPFAIVGAALAVVSMGVRKGMDDLQAKKNVNTLDEIADYGTQVEFKDDENKRDRDLRRKQERKDKVKAAPSPLKYMKRKIGSKATSKKGSAKDAAGYALNYGGKAAEVGEKGLSVISSTSLLDATQALGEQTGLGGLSVISATYSAVRGGGGPKDIRTDFKRMAFATRFLKMRREGVARQSESLTGFEVTVTKALATYYDWLDSNGDYCAGNLPDDNGTPVENWAGNIIVVRLRQHIDLTNSKQLSFQEGTYHAITSCHVIVEYQYGPDWLEHPDSGFDIDDFLVTFYVDGFIEHSPVKVENLKTEYNFSYAIWLTADAKFFDESQPDFLDAANHPYSYYTTYIEPSEQGPATFTPSGILTIGIGDPDYEKFTEWRNRANELLREKESSRDYSDDRF